jgi:hypothetical protein
LDPTTRYTTTVKAFQKVIEQENAALVEPLNLCDLDDRLAAFCREMQGHRGAVAETNCQAAGSCFTEMFYYQPSMYSMSNNQFARRTVEDFYVGITPGVCAAQTSARQAEIEKQNAAFIQLCPTTMLEKFKEVLVVARIQVGAIIRATYFAMMVVLHACRLILIPGTDAELQAILSDMRINLDLMLEEISAAMMAMFDFIFQTILDTPVGMAIEETIIAICDAVNMLIDVFVIKTFCPIKKWITDMLTDLIDALVYVPLFDTRGLVVIRNQMLALSCDPDDLLSTCVRASSVAPQPLPRIDAPTRCWSTYVNTLGDASSLSCSAADSCVVFNPVMLDGGVVQDSLVACDDCLPPPLPDFSRYGCDVVRKQCKCHVQPISRTACINHIGCNPPTDATCDILESSFSTQSFGTQPCDSCATGGGMCIAAPGGARCSCPLTEESLHTCMASEVGLSIIPDEGALCLVAIGSSTILSASTSSDFVLKYEDLAASPCGLIQNPICYQVWKSGYRSTFIVGIETVGMGRRRLLEESQTSELAATIAGVLHIAAHDLERVADLPWDAVLDDGCRMVGPLGSLIYKTNLSVSDHILYKQCVRWRAIGDDVRRSFNLTVPDTFLVSMRDLAAVFRDPAFLVRLARHPEMFVYAALHSEVAAPARAFFRSLRVWAVHGMTYLTEHTRWLKGQYSEKQTANSTNSTTKNNSDSKPTKGSDNRRVHTAHSLRLELMRAAPMPSYTQEPVQHTEEQVDAKLETPMQPTPGRRLFSFQESLQAVKRYSTALALGDGATQVLGGYLSDAFVNGPIPFPPTFVAYDVTLACTPAWNTVVLFKESFNLVAKYFSSSVPRPTVERDVLLSLPTFGSNYRDAAKAGTTTFDTPQHSFAGDTGRYIFETIGGFDPDYIRDILAGLPDFIRRLFTCDIESVMYCTQFRYSLFSSAIVVAVLLYVTGIMLSSLGVPFTWTIIGLVYVQAVLFYSLGYSPFCAPLVPTCIGDEIIEMFNLLIPVRLYWPRALQRSVGCIEDANIPVSDCMVSCSTHPFNYVGWAEPIAWTVCELNLNVCRDMHLWLSTQSFASSPGSILHDASNALWRSHAILSYADTDSVAAFRVCAMFTSWRAIPILFILMFTVYAVPVVVMAPIQFLFAGTQMVIAALSMSHTHLREPTLEMS